jgi:hypothetical protein
VLRGRAFPREPCERAGNFKSQAEGKTPEDIINDLINAVPEPTIEKYEKR